MPPACCYFQTASPCFWLGLERSDENSGYTWADGTRFEGFNDSVIIFEKNSAMDKYKNCACIYKREGGQQYTVMRSYCSNYYHFICQKKGNKIIVIGYCCSNFRKLAIAVFACQSASAFLGTVKLI